jgi:hypothetical protein
MSDNTNPEAENVVAEPLVWVRASVGRNAEEGYEEKKLAVRRFVTNPARVKIDRGVTINLGNYESARVDVGVDIPCYVEQLREGFIEADKLVKQYLSEAVAGFPTGTVSGHLGSSKPAATTSASQPKRTSRDL